jgi:hypothetical protein
LKNFNSDAIDVKHVSRSRVEVGRISVYFFALDQFKRHSRVAARDERRGFFENLTCKQNEKSAGFSPNFTADPDCVLGLSPVTSDRDGWTLERQGLLVRETARVVT